MLIVIRVRFHLKGFHPQSLLFLQEVSLKSLEHVNIDIVGLMLAKSINQSISNRSVKKFRADKTQQRLHKDYV